MKESWTDFEKYVFEKLEANHDDHVKLHTDIAVLKERTRPVIKKPSNVVLKVGSIVAVVSGIVTACRGLAK